MTAGKTEKLGGITVLSFPMLEGERLIREEGALLHNPPGDVFALSGRVYLTNLRFIWTPLIFYWWLRMIRRPVVFVLTDIQECFLGESGLGTRFQTPIVVRTDKDACDLAMDGNWTKAYAFDWMSEIQRAIWTAKRVAAESS